MPGVELDAWPCCKEMWVLGAEACCNATARALDKVATFTVTVAVEVLVGVAIKSTGEKLHLHVSLTEKAYLFRGRLSNSNSTK